MLEALKMCLKIKNIIWKENKMIFYIIKRRDGSVDNNYFGAYLSKEMAQLALNVWGLGEMYDYGAELRFVDEVEIKSENIGRHILFCRFYRGYDYNYETGGIVDVSNDSCFAANLDQLKDAWLYQQCLNDMKCDTTNKFIQLSDGSIGHRDSYDSQNLFSYGDIFEGKWSLRVEKLRIYKGDTSHLQDHLRSLYNKYRLTIQ